MDGMSPVRHPRKKANTERAHEANFLLVLRGMLIGMACLVVAGIIGYSNFFGGKYHIAVADPSSPSAAVAPAVLDTQLYDLKMMQVANNATSTRHTSLATSTATTSPHVAHTLWPVKAVYPNAGAILPFNRIVAYYGNFYSKGMGVLGEYPQDQMLSMLKAEVAKWQAADPTTPVIPAIDYIVVTAQGSPGKDGKYRLRMPDTQVDHAVALAKQVNGLVFLDVQVGLSDLQSELPLYEKYFAMENVELAIDPEFSMKGGEKPGTVIGTFSSSDVNYAANYLAKIVKENNLPPKILVVHRFTEEMVTGYKNITPLPEVQIVMDMDGWGNPAKKLGTYHRVVYDEPVQFTGFKLFYKNDLRAPSTRMLTPADLLKLTPQPLFIQYQ